MVSIDLPQAFSSSHPCTSWVWPMTTCCCYLLSIPIGFGFGLYLQQCHGGKCSLREKMEWHAALNGTVAIISKIHFSAACCFVAQMGQSLFCISLSWVVLRNACCDLLSTERKDRLDPSVVAKL